MGSKSVFPCDKNMDYVYYVFIKFLSLIVVNKYTFLFVISCRDGFEECVSRR